MPKGELVKGKGPIPCVGMIIGEAPGAEEEKLGEPFVGRSGDLLDQALAVAGANRSMFYITNVYKLRPPENRTPTDKETASHSMLLQKELIKVSPKYILCVGLTAVGVFYYPQYGITKLRGKPLKTGEYWVIPTFHPAYCLRKPDEKPLFFDDVEQFVSLAYGGND